MSDAPDMPLRKGASPEARARLFVVAALVTSGCVGTERSENGSSDGELVLWDFSAEPAEELLVLYPAERRTPERIKQHLWTNADKGPLTARVEGRDPLFMWKFETPISVGAVHMDIDANRDGYLQLFWNNTECPVFSEPCSQRLPVRRGAQPLDFALAVQSPIRELRLDLAEDGGFSIDFARIALSKTRTVRSMWSSGNGETVVEAGPGGLVVIARSTDPWISTTTPPTAAHPSDVIELTLSRPTESPAQLFWTGDECPFFQERCSVVVPHLDGGAGTLSVAMASREGWNGRISSIRLDPGTTPGRYELVSVRWKRVETAPR